MGTVPEVPIFRWLNLYGFDRCWLLVSVKGALDCVPAAMFNGTA